MTYTLDEWFVVALSRTIRDRESVFHGFGSPCAQVAMHVAKRTHARDMLLIEGAMYALNPDPPFIPPTGNDASLKRGAAYSMRFEEFFDAAIRGDIDRMFLSGGQIDAYGNTNVTVIGPLERPKVKLGGGGRRVQHLAATIQPTSPCGPPGTGQRPHAGRCRATSSPTSGHRTPGRNPRRARLSPAAARRRLVTELGVFDYGADGRSAPDCTCSPDVTVDQVQRPRRASNFTVVAGDLRQPAPPPRAAELAVVRSIP